MKPLGLGKCKTSRGATLPFALTIFLIACMMSMVIVNAALSNAQRIRREREERQAMLAISSAMPIVEAVFSSCRGELASGHLDSVWIDEAELQETQPALSAALRQGGLSSLKTSVKNAIIAAGSAGNTADAVSLNVRTLSLTGPASEGALDIDIEVTRKEDYTLIVTLKKKRAGTTDKYVASQTITFPAMVLEDAGTAENGALVEW